MIIYIASPYSAHDDKQAAVNAQIDAFAALRDMGHEPIAPLLSHYVDRRHPASYERWMQWCLAMVSVADAVLRLPGKSAGADREVAEARRLGKPVVHGLDTFLHPGQVYIVDELNIAPYLEGETIKQYDYTYTWADHQVANQQALDDIAAVVGAER